jgi:iron complex outermembrane receptor protein
MSLTQDTVRINEVVISRKLPDSDPAGYKTKSFDSVILDNYSHGTLAEVLARNSEIFIKSYGMGGSATCSLRGTGAGHTQTSWNGININYPMSGQADLSLIPVGLIDGIQIYFGGASMELNSGGIGGIINLETKPDWKKQTMISINPGAGSFGRYSGMVSLRTGNSRFETSTKAYFNSSENDFRYLNNEISSDPVWEVRKNSQVVQKGFIQELYFRKSNSSTSARVWYQSTGRNLPSSMLIQQPTGEKQFDESLRTMFSHDIFKGRSSYSLTGAYLMSTLDYTNTLASIDSRNNSRSMILKAGLENQITESLKLKVVINEELSVSKTNNYEENAKRNTVTLTASAEKTGQGRLSSVFLVRETLDNQTLLIPDFSAGFQFRLSEGNKIKANISRNSKIPSMNDLYWVPGGNPDLKNEYAFTCELSYEMVHKISNTLNLDYDLTVFRNDIKDMIQWHPGEFSYWMADNIRNVKTSGIESSGSLTYTLNNIKSGINAGYAYTRASDLSGDKNQLIYVPAHQANVSVNFSWSWFYSSFVTNITGKRYTTADNSRYLPGYVLNSILTGARLKLKESIIDLNFNIDNLFNINYQTIAYYPLPGRYYTVKLLFQIIK